MAALRQNLAETGSLRGPQHIDRSPLRPKIQIRSTAGNRCRGRYTVEWRARSSRPAYGSAIGRPRRQPRRSSLSSVSPMIQSPLSSRRPGLTQPSENGSGITFLLSSGASNSDCCRNSFLPPDTYRATSQSQNHDVQGRIVDVDGSSLCDEHYTIETSSTPATAARSNPPSRRLSAIKPTLS